MYKRVNLIIEMKTENRNAVLLPSTCAPSVACRRTPDRVLSGSARSAVNRERWASVIIPVRKTEAIRLDDSSGVFLKGVEAIWSVVLQRPPETVLALTHTRLQSQRPQSPADPCCTASRRAVVSSAGHRSATPPDILQSLCWSGPDPPHILVSFRSCRESPTCRRITGYK